MSSVIIVGGGIGGLCLAQGLERAGIEFEVLEADAGPQVRDQGYRLRIDAMGQRALRQCLAPELFELFRASCAVSGPARFVDPQMNPLPGRRPENWRENAGAGQANGDLSADRQVLRDILSHGLAARIRWGGRARGFERDGDGVAVHCADGAEHRAGLVVAADGLHSPLRRQWLPQAEPEAIGALNLYGKAALDGVDPALLDGPTVVFADGFTLVIEPMRFRAPMETLAALHAPDCRLSPAADYVYWALFGRMECLGGTFEEAGGSLRRRVEDAARGLHPSLSALLARTEPETIKGREVRMASHVPMWPTGRLTALGDAIHAMSPAGGVGANTALADAAALAACLAEGDVGQAVARYEAEMRGRAEQALAATRAGTERLLRRA
ncbi:FAD-dependent oxidoreductase [Chromobacterium vaccinii]|uniref:FAD-dependent oxidoreductase n=1 Tax=Chromobacterium vaccinii TaxID=1108595 RepID=UPI000E130D67|nr:FAD-dependent monooxygenase [Chromobacterium vaccinii]SUX55821.1 6-hydroxynicotinate 3-monooxygenase precursor [Chromobacterium vaccinii]